MLVLPQLQPFRGHKAKSQPLWPGEIPKRFAFRQQHQQRALAELHVAVRELATHQPHGTEGTCNPEDSLLWKIKPAYKARELSNWEEGRLSHSNIQYTLPQSQGRAVRDTCVCHQQRQQVTSLPRERRTPQCVRWTRRQRPGSCLSGVLCYQVCRDDRTVTIFSSVSVNQFTCRLNWFIPLCLHFYTYKMGIESAAFLFGKIF